MRATVKAISRVRGEFVWELSHTSLETLVPFIEAIRETEEYIYRVEVTMDWPCVTLNPTEA